MAGAEREREPVRTSFLHPPPATTSGEKRLTKVEEERERERERKSIINTRVGHVVLWDSGGFCRPLRLREIEGRRGNLDDGWLTAV